MCGSGFLLKMCMLLALFTDNEQVSEISMARYSNFICAFYPYLKFFHSLKKSYIVSCMSSLSIVVIDINCSFESNYGYLTFLVQAMTGLLLGVCPSECRVFIDFKNRLSSALKFSFLYCRVLSSCGRYRLSE